MPGFMNNDGSELVGGQLPGGAGQALQLDSGGNLKATINGSPMNALNPVITQPQVIAALLAGKVFTASTPKLTGVANNTGAACLFNPSNSGKTLLVVSIHGYCNAAAQGTIELVTADPTLGTAMTVSSNEGGSGAPVSVISTSASYAASGLTPSVTPNGVWSTAAGTMIEILSNGNAIWLPVGVASGVKPTITTGAANPFGFVITWIEY